MVLGLSSPYFYDCLKSDFVEGQSKEFIFEKESPHALWRVLQYLYTGDYSDGADAFLEAEGESSTKNTNKLY